MKIIQLATLKVVCNVTTSAQEPSLTFAGNFVEAEVEKYLGRDLTTYSVADKTLLEGTLTSWASMKWNNQSLDIWTKGILARSLFPFRVPAIGIGATS